MTTNASLPGPDNIVRSLLPNGIVVLIRSTDTSPSFSIHGSLPAGALFEPDEKLGLALFTAGSLMRGTQTRSFQETYDRLESAGASLGFSSGVHTTGLHGKALAEDLDLILETAADALRRPTFPPEYIERLRQQYLTSLVMRDQDTADRASLLFEAMLYPAHPYGRPEDGTPDTVRAITRQDVIDFHQRVYGPQGMLLTVAGGLQPQHVLDRIAHYFGDWRNPLQPVPPALPPIRPLGETLRAHATLPGKSQVDIVMGAVGPTRADPDYFSASIGNNILGQFGMMGRIGEAVREKAGLAYYASSSLGAGLGPGPWEISAGVDPQNTGQAIDLVLQEVRRFIQDPVTAEELEDVKTNYIGRLPLSLEANSGIAAALLTIERYDLGLDYYQRYPALVRAVQAGDVLRAAQRFLDPDRFVIATAGPAD